MTVVAARSPGTTAAADTIACSRDLGRALGALLGAVLLVVGLRGPRGARPHQWPRRPRQDGPRRPGAEAAILIPAHNEELVIEATLRSVVEVQDPRHVYVFCDACTDSTVEIAHRYLPPSNVIDHDVNVGKSRGLEIALAERIHPAGYEYVSIVDADTTVEPQFLERALGVVRRPDVACAVGQVKSRWYPDNLISVYRTFIYVLWQALAKRVQSGVNAITIASGCSTTWKTAVLRQLEFDHQMSTEDFSLTIQVHRKSLGKIKYVPGAVVWTQDPFGVDAYYRQSYRWMRAWWESVRKYRVGLHLLRRRGEAPVSVNVLDVATIVLLGGIFVFFGLMAVVPVLVLVPVPVTIGVGGADLVSLEDRFDYLRLLALLYLTVVLLSVVAAVVSRRPQVAASSAGFIVLLYLDMWIAVRTMLSTARRQYRASGPVEGSVWASVDRRGLPAEGPPPGAAPSREEAEVGAA
jgi:poly-beta-1,6-N-acetyl-D-glucosamine synthase